MSLERTLGQRAGNKCELCGNDKDLSAYTVLPLHGGEVNSSVLVCGTCKPQIEGEITDVNHWRCLNDSMWSAEVVVQVLSHRLLEKLKPESWAQDLQDMMYLEDDMLEWSKAGFEEEDDTPPTLDANGAILQSGDNVVIIKDLPVKGKSMIIKRGTPVRNISVGNDPKYIEGRADGQHMVIIAEYVKK
ncbi:PhnA domain-containing protein [Paraferrimonas sp. SM1919]|uniref:PhnA domain-containing protein n=1 Tax=Paraferrimonas sp. SM1919 TaxID=2662263 RepID=UPI0013D62A20|nr:PhnA domain-containing protein [Paraferrimonas sp. SM1919]